MDDADRRWSEWARRALGQAYGGLRLAGLLAAGLLSPAGRPRPLTAVERLAALPLAGAPVELPVTIRWDDHQVPFVEAATDGDLAAGLGIVHAHLRLAQMEVMRRLAHGRVAEVLGPAAIDLDHQLRALDLGRATAAILGEMPEETRGWLDRFVGGLNHVIARAALPPEFRLLGLPCEAWTADEVVTVGRLASADLNWIVLFNALKVYRSAHWQAVWTNLMGDVYLPDAEDAIGLATSFTHSGSNALAVAGWRRGEDGGGGGSRQGAIVAGDPHLDLVLPNFWLLGGLRSPSFHAVGLMIPGLPFVAMGRNPHIAWSGTSLHAASTDLYDASDLPTTQRDERIRVRWWSDRRLALRETRLGPVITDAKPLSGVSRPVALRWMGHRPSDEFTAMLALNRARDWPEFAAAAARIGVPGQTLLYGDAAGHIGKCLAVRLPARPPGRPADLLAMAAADGADLDDPWQRTMDGSALPQIFDPPEGWVVSANLPPAGAPVAVAYFHSPPYREERMAELLGWRPKVTMEDVVRLQRDVHSQPSLLLRDWLFDLAMPLVAGSSPLLTALAEWDGDYHRDSVGAVAYERLIYCLLRLLEGRDMRRILAALWDPAGIVRARLSAMPPDTAGVLVRQALAKAGRGFSPRRRWGSLHRLRLPHLFGHLPGVGGLFTYGDYPWPGGNETLMKAAHHVTKGRHAVRYGANARFVADLSDLDRTLVVLVGGQDGWLGSANFMDQVELWHQDRLIRLPMRAETVRRLFPHVTVLTR